MKYNENEIKDLITLLGFTAQKSNSNKYKKQYQKHDNYSITIDFETRKINYDKPMIITDKTTSNFESSENFVVLECVNRLLEKGYKPENIELERKWNLGHRDKGKADIFVNYPKKEGETEGKAFLLIECKTWGNEFNKEFEKMLSTGGQLLSYYQQEQTTEFLCLYSSHLENNEIHFTNRIIEIKEEYKAKNKAEIFKIWKEQFEQTFKYNGIFDEDEDIKPYNKILKNLKCKDLSELQEGDSGYIFNKFAEILRHNVVSDKPNAFNKMFNLILAKIVDEDSEPNDILQFQWYENDDDKELQKRLNDLYKKGMLDYLHKIVTDFSDKEMSHFLDNPNISSEYKDILKNKITELRLYKNNEFAFKEVFNEHSFKDNAIVVRETVKLLQPFRIRYSHKQQFLSNFFELLLSNTLKQEAGQFFTPVPVAKFIVTCFPMKEFITNKIKEGKPDILPYVIDFAAGSGHFLTETMDELQQIIETIDYQNCKPSLKQKIKSFQNEKYDWARDYIYGIEKDYRLSKIAKVSCFLNGDGLANIIHADGLESYQSEEYKNAPLLNSNKKDSFDNQKFDILVANPPYSVSAFIKTLPNANQSFEIADKFTEQSKEIECLFIERTKQLLKDNGWAGIILPSSILSNAGIYTSAREIILKYFKIIGIVEFGSGTFMATGTNTITLFLERRNNLEWTVINKAIDQFFTDKQDNICNGIENPIEKYVNHVFNNNLSDFVSFIEKNPNEIIKETELYKNYHNWYYSLSETKNLQDRIKKQKTDLEILQTKEQETTATKEIEKIQKRISETEKQIEKLENDLIRLFYERTFEREKEKMLYFILTFPQTTILIKSNPTGNNDKEKEFLGYEFSNRRGHEGLRMFTDENGVFTTKLYHETDRQDETKINSYIYKHFNKIENITIIDELFENIKFASLYELINFNTTDFIKDISISSVKSTDYKFDTKFKTVKLRSVVDYYQGLVFDKKDESVTETKNKVFTASNINLENSSIDYSKIKYLKPEIQIDTIKLLKQNDIFICTSSGSISHLGKSVFIEKDLETAFGGFCCVLRSQSTTNPKYIYSLLNSIQFKKFILTNKGSNINNLSRETLLDFAIPLPSIEIQNEICNEISKFETKIEKIIEDIFQFNSIIDDEINKIYSDNYEFVKLGSICNILGGGTPSTKNREFWDNGNIFWATLVDTKQKYLFSTQRKITEKGLKGSNATLLPINTVIFSSRATIGDVSIAKTETCTNQGYKNFICNPDKIHYELLYYILKRESKNIESLASGMTYPEISKSAISDFKIPLPPIKKQEKIISDILTIEQNINDLQNKLTQLKTEKEQVLQKYL